jgi:hypothetical protein
VQKCILFQDFFWPCIIMSLRVHDHVIVRGLKSTAGQALNNKVAEIITDINQDNRYEVLFRFDGTPRRIKVSNLIRRPYSIGNTVVFDFPNGGKNQPPLVTVAAEEDDLYGSSPTVEIDGVAITVQGGIAGLVGNSGNMEWDDTQSRGNVLTAQELHGQAGTIHAVPVLSDDNGVQDPPPSYEIRFQHIIYVVSADQSRRLPRDSIVDFIADRSTSTDLSISGTVDQILQMMRTATDYSVVEEKFCKLYSRIYSQGTPTERTEALVCLLPHLKEMFLCLTAPKWDTTESTTTICRAWIVLHILNMYVSYPFSRCKLQRSSGDLPAAVGRIVQMYPQLKTQRSDRGMSFALRAVFLLWGIVTMPLKKKNAKKEMKLHYAFLENKRVRNVLETISRGATETERRANLHRKCKDVMLMWKLMERVGKKRYQEICEEHHDGKVQMINDQMGNSTVMSVHSCTADNCGNVESIGLAGVAEGEQKFLKCSGCGGKYCSRECQRWDWKVGGHKDECLKKKTLKKKKNKKNKNSRR